MDLLLRLAADVQNSRPLVLDETFVECFNQVLQTDDLDPASMALILTLPSEKSVLEQMKQADPQAIHAAHLFLRQTLANHLHPTLLKCFHINDTEQVSNRYDPAAAGRRALKNLCLDFLVTLQWQDMGRLAYDQFKKSDTMTDCLAALTALLHSAIPEAEVALESFAKKWNHNPLVMDKWFAIQAQVPDEKTLDRVKLLQNNALFSLKNPNRVRALIGSYCHNNPVSFHQSSGKGYGWLVEHVLALDTINPQVAARLVSAMTGWKKLEPNRRLKMQAALQTVHNSSNLSRDVFEIVSKSLV